MERKISRKDSVTNLEMTGSRRATMFKNRDAEQPESVTPAKQPESVTPAKQPESLSPKNAGRMGKAHLATNRGGGIRLTVNPIVATTDQAMLVAQVMVRDACAMNTSCYFATIDSWADSILATPRGAGAEDGEARVCSQAATQGSTERSSETWHQHQSVWSADYVQWNIWINQWFLMAVAWVLMANTLIEEPYNDRIYFWEFNLRQVPSWVGHAIFFLCHFVLLVLFIVVFACMWPTRHNWLIKDLAVKESRSTFWSSTRATEQWWTIAFGACVISSIVIRLTWMYRAEHPLEHESDPEYPWYYERTTIFGDVRSGLDVGWRAFRCFYLLYLSPRMRYGFVSALYVATTLGSIAGLVVISFLFHYFLIVAFLPLNDHDAGTYYPERELYFSTTNQGLYNLFVALTTANHPDVLMPSYERHWYMMLLLFSFMCITNLFLLNVFLGVVTTQYKDMVEQFYLGKNEVCEGILASAYRLLRSRDFDSVHAGDDIELSASSKTLYMESSSKGDIELSSEEWNCKDRASREEQLRVMQEKDAGLGKSDFLSVIQLLNGVHQENTEKQELWFNIMDVDGDARMNLEEFEKLTYIVPMPFEKTKHNDVHLNQPRYSRVREFVERDLLFYIWPSKRRLKRLADAEERHAQTEAEVKRLHADLATPHSKSARHMIESELEVAEETAARAAKTVEGVKKRKGTSTYGLFISMVILFSIVNALWLHPAPSSVQELDSESCGDSSNLLQLILGIVFFFDVIIGCFSESTFRKPLRYFYGRNWFYNWTDTLVVILTFTVVATTCSGSSNSRVNSIVGLLRVFRCVRMIQHIESFRRMYNAATRVMPAITPQLLLFVTAYYSFACLGMALFAGCVTEVTDDGGPGDWSTSPWKDTVFGGDLFYYNLNFDNIYASFITLFMLMIQNNWHVTVDGYVQCTGTMWVRSYFISFNCITAMILINIFIGVVLDMFELYWHDEQYKMGLEAEDKFDNFYQIINHRLDNKMDLKTTPNKPLSYSWRVSHEIDSGLLYSGVSPSDAVMLISEIAKHKELVGLKSILNNSPMPIYVRTAGNKIAFANTVFAGLYDATSVMARKDAHIVWKGVVHTIRLHAMETDLWNTQSLRFYRMVVFKCTERPVDISFFKHTTVVYMFPMHGEDGRVLLDTDGDGRLSKQDATPYPKSEHADATNPTLNTITNPICEI